MPVLLGVLAFVGIFLFVTWLFKTLWFFSIVPIFGLIPLTYGQSAALLGLLMIVASAFRTEFKLKFKQR